MPMREAGTADATPQPRALVVDDDPVTRRVVRLTLERTLCAVREASNGVEAQAMLGDVGYDVVVTDLSMPQLDGLGLMRWAAEHARGPLWIILSSMDSFDAAVEAVRLGAYEFLSKPPHTGQLEVIVRNALERRHLERERERLHTELTESHRSLALKVHELEERSEANRRDLRRAETIQRALLPQQPPSVEGLCLQALYRPGRHVGGDLYNVRHIGDHHLAIYVADATGHGVSSAMLSVLFHRKLVLADERTGVPFEPGRVLAAVNRAMCAEQLSAGLFLTAVYCLIDTDTWNVTIALAGHPPALLFRDGLGIERFHRTGPALGLTPDATYRNEQLTIEPGDRLLLYTDGLLDSMPDTEHARALLETTLASAQHEGYAIVAHLADAVRTNADDDGDDDRDDITILLLETRAGTSRLDNGASSPIDTGKRTAPRTPVVFYGESEESSFFTVRGRGSWTHADAFHAAASGILDEGRTVIVDLAECEHLDSTFLGTIHELSVGPPAHHGGFSLQRVPAAIRGLFEELSMNTVLAAIRDDPLPVPEMRPLLDGTEPEGAHARILRAHETLAALSARNREKFLGVVEAMRAQLDA